MKILEIIPILNAGGAQRFVTDLSNSLSHSHDVYVLVLYPLDEFAPMAKELNPNVKIISVNKRHGLSISALFSVYKLVRKIKPDVVHSHLNAIIYLFFPLLLLKKVRFYHTIHNDAYMEAGNVLNRLFRKYCFKNKLVFPITISEESNTSFLKCYGCDATMIYNGRPAYDTIPDIDKAYCEIKSLRHSPSSKILVNVARICEQKNQLSLIQAIKEINADSCRIELFILGTTIDRSILEEINSLSLPYIHILGVRENPRDYMAAADAFCLSSIYEGMPITLIEAFSVGQVSLCTAVGGIKNMITHMENGIFFPGIDKRSLVDGLIQFLTLSTDELERIRCNSRASYSKYTMERCSTKYEQLMLTNR